MRPRPNASSNGRFAAFRRQIAVRSRAGLRRISRSVPPGLRLPLGLVLTLLGVVGFLPVVGFWMIPLGLAVMWLDLRPVWRAIRKRLGG